MDLSLMFSVVGFRFNLVSQTKKKNQAFKQLLISEWLVEKKKIVSFSLFSKESVIFETMFNDIVKVDKTEKK